MFVIVCMCESGWHALAACVYSSSPGAVPLSTSTPGGHRTQWSCCQLPSTEQHPTHYAHSTTGYVPYWITTDTLGLSPLSIRGPQPFLGAFCGLAIIMCCVVYFQTVHYLENLWHYMRHLSTRRLQQHADSIAVLYSLFCVCVCVSVCVCIF